MQKKVVITHRKHMCDFNFIGNMIHILNQTFSQECDQKLDDVIYKCKSNQKFLSKCDHFFTLTLFHTSNL